MAVRGQAHEFMLAENEAHMPAAARTARRIAGLRQVDHDIDDAVDDLADLCVGRLEQGKPGDRPEGRTVEAIGEEMQAGRPSLGALGQEDERILGAVAV